MKGLSQPAGAHGSRLTEHSSDQHGAALIVGLIILLVMTMLGLGSMRTSALQELMAGHTKDSNSAFQAAEAALEAAHFYVCHLERAQQAIPLACSTSDPDPESCSDGSTDPCCFFRSAIAAWKAYPHNESGKLLGSKITSLSEVGWASVADEKLPHYIIEYHRGTGTGSALGVFKDVAALGLGSGDGSAPNYFATIATIGFDPAANSRSIIQMTQKLNF